MAFVKISEQASLYNDLEKKPVREILEDINREDHKVADAVEKAIPQIQPYCSTDKTRHILRNPFYLNTACSIAIIANASTFKESEFKDRLCRQIVSGMKHDAQFVNQRIEALIDVARRTSQIGMNLVKCEMTDAVKSLVDDDILIGQPALGQLRPGHDILTDWGLYCYIDNNLRDNIGFVQYFKGNFSL